MQDHFFTKLICVIASFAIVSTSSARANVTDPNEGVELHYLLCPQSQHALLESYRVSEFEAERRTVYYFDTESREHYRNGLVIKATDKSNKTRVDLKRRPMDREQVSSTWKTRKGFLCEYDRYIDREQYACRLRAHHKDDSLRRVISGEASPKLLFKGDSDRFIADFYGEAIDWTDLKIIGGVAVHKWEIERASLEIDIEIWVLPSRPPIYEVSTRSPSLAAADRNDARMLRHFQDHGLQLCDEQRSKTSQVMQTFFGAEAGAN